MSKITLLALITLCTNGLLTAQTIAAARLGQWDNVGAMTQNLSNNTIEILDWGVQNDGTADASVNIQNAINSLAGQAGTLHFPSGNYLLEHTIRLPSNVSIQGEGISTVLVLNSEENGITIEGQGESTYYTITQNAAIGANYILQPTIAATSTPNSFLELRQQNGAWDIVPVSWASYSIGQILTIASISGDTIFLKEPLAAEYFSSLSAEIRTVQPAENIGIECIKIKRNNTPANAANNIYINLAHNCWIKNIESNRSMASHISAFNSKNISVTNSFIHNGYIFDGTGTRGYGVTFAHHTSKCLIENNVFDTLRHAMILKQGAHNNIIAYNYSKTTLRSEFPANGSADISLHGHYPYNNLIEGNIVQTIWADDAWGTNGPNNTIFRNRVQLYGILCTNPETSGMNVVGNEVTNGTFFMGNISLQGTNHFLYGNNRLGNIEPAGTTSLAQQSLYLTQAPNFWSTSNFNSIGIGNTYNTGTIPAKERSISGTIVSCIALDTNTVGIANTDLEHWQIIQNAAYSTLQIINTSKLPTSMKIIDITGKIMYTKQGIIANELTIDTYDWQAGMYYIISDVKTKKILLIK